MKGIPFLFINFTKLSLLCLFLFSWSACVDRDPDYCLPNIEEDPPGLWYHGDFHVHATGASNDTGGDSFPPDIRAMAFERDLDFLVLTDHSNSTGSDATTTEEDPALFNQGPEFPYWETAAELSDDIFLMVCGNEISPVQVDEAGPTGHIGCIPKDLANFDTSVVFIDRPRGTVNGASALQQAKDAGCFSVLNHPYSTIAPWIAFDWTSLDYDAIEVWNGTVGYDPWDEQATAAWICDLLGGKQVTAIGGSDNHRIFTPIPGQGLDPALGYPTTAVYAQSLAWPDIMTALQEGNTMIFEGDSRIRIDGYNDNGCFGEPKDIRTIRLRGTADAELPDPQLIVYRATGCTDPRPDLNPPTLAGDTLSVKTLIPGESFDIRLPIFGESGVYTARVAGNSVHYQALSRAIVIP